MEYGGGLSRGVSVLKSRIHDLGEHGLFTLSIDIYIVLVFGD